MHYDGFSWAAWGGPGGTPPLPYGVWGGSHSDVFAVGAVGYEQDSILHYDGSSWSATALSGLGLHSVWGTSYSDVFAVGIVDGQHGGAILHYGP